MKKRLLSLALGLCTLLAAVLLLAPAMTVTAEAADVTINDANFPDANFRAYVSTNFNTNSDGVLSASEIAAVKTITVDGKSIASLKGVEYFTALTKLSCVSNQLTVLDVSKNTALTYLNCDYNQLTSLDVSGCTALTSLSCYINKLTSLDVSKNTALTHLGCGGNQLTSLDVSQNRSLMFLGCENSQLTSLDVSKNTELESLGCDRNQLTSLDVTKNLLLESLGCSRNQLTSLDVSKNTALTYLDCSVNQLTSLDVSKNTELEILYCSRNPITSLDVRGCPALKTLSCYSNQLTSLDVSKNTALKELDCGDNRLTALDVSKNTALMNLSCYGNSIAVLDVSACPKLVDAYTNGTKTEYGVDGFNVWEYNHDGNILQIDPATAVRTQNLAAPKITSANGQNATGKPTLKWNAVSGAAKYAIYRSDRKDGTYTKMYTTTSTSYTNTSANAGYTYYYKVVAVNGGGVEGLPGTPIGVRCRPAAPTITSANGSNASGKPTLKWNAVSGAKEYVIYRSGTSNGTYTKLYTTTNTSFTNTGANAGYTYYYKVYAVDKDGYWSVASAVNGVHCRPAAPTVTATTGSSGKPYLKWSAVTGAKEYVVYRATSKTGSYTKMFTTTNTSYTNTTAKAGNTYWYKVYAVDAKGFWSIASTPVSAKATK